MPASPALAVTTDCAGLQQALDDATDGTTVTLAAGSVCTDSYTLPSGTDVVLEGGGDGATLAGDGESRLLEGFGVGETVIRNLHFDGGRTQGHGAAIFIAGYDALTIADNVFTDNESGSSGGAVAVRPRSDNLARALQGDEGPGGVTIDGNVFGGENGNDAAQNGGGLSIEIEDTVTLTDNVFEENTAHAVGGGAAVTFCGEATVAGNTFDDNSVASFFQGSRAPASEVFGGHVLGGGLAIARADCFVPQLPERTAQGARRLSPSCGRAATASSPTASRPARTATPRAPGSTCSTRRWSPPTTSSTAT